MIIIITNRNVNSQHNDERVFGNDMSNDGLRVAEFQYLVQEIDDEFSWDITDDFDDGFPEETWQPTVYNKGEEEKLFNKAVRYIVEGREGASRPWVLFLHGNNQDTRSNLVKCRKLKQVHDVNIIAFSWPSQPHTFVENAKRAASDTLSVKDLKNIINGSVPEPASLGLKFFKELAEKKKEDYETAKKRAKQTAPEFVAALKMIKSLFVDKVKAEGHPLQLSLLVHSLGNQVFEHSDFSSDITNEKMFTNVIMHQSDVQHEGHDTWINKRMLDIGHNAYVSTNYYDWVLWLSSLANKKDRLGMTRKELTAGNVTYFDMTDGINVDNLHNFFHMKKYQNESINKLFNGLLRSQTNLNFEQLGFIKSPAGPLAYSLKELASDEDDGD